MAGLLSHPRHVPSSPPVRDRRAFLEKDGPHKLSGLCEPRDTNGSAGARSGRRSGGFAMAGLLNDAGAGRSPLPPENSCQGGAPAAWMPEPWWPQEGSLIPNPSNAPPTDHQSVEPLPADGPGTARPHTTKQLPDINRNLPPQDHIVSSVAPPLTMSTHNMSDPKSSSNSEGHLPFSGRLTDLLIDPSLDNAASAPVHPEPMLPRPEALDSAPTANPNEGIPTNTIPHAQLPQLPPHPEELMANRPVLTLPPMLAGLDDPPPEPSAEEAFPRITLDWPMDLFDDAPGTPLRRSARFGGAQQLDDAPSSAEVKKGSRLPSRGTKPSDPKQLRRKWTDEQSDALLRGVVKHGVGRWRAILQDSEFSHHFTGRSNIDLKDRYRTLRPTTGLKRKPPASTRTTGLGQRDSSGSSTPARIRGPRKRADKSMEEFAAMGIAEPRESFKRKLIWSAADDANLEKGLELYGTNWAEIRDTMGFEGRNLMLWDLRDRCRVLFPAKFEEAQARIRQAKLREQEAKEAIAYDKPGFAVVFETPGESQANEMPGDREANAPPENSQAHEMPWDSQANAPLPQVSIDGALIEWSRSEAERTHTQTSINERPALDHQQNDYAVPTRTDAEKSQPASASASGMRPVPMLQIPVRGNPPPPSFNTGGPSTAPTSTSAVPYGYYPDTGPAPSGPSTALTSTTAVPYGYYPATDSAPPPGRLQRPTNDDTLPAPVFPPIPSASASARRLPPAADLLSESQGPGPSQNQSQGQPPGRYQEQKPWERQGQM